MYNRLRGSNQWPDAVLPKLKPAVEEYAAEMGRISEELTEALCMSLGWEADALQDLFFEVDQKEMARS